MGFNQGPASEAEAAAKEGSSFLKNSKLGEVLDLMNHGRHVPVPVAPFEHEVIGRPGTRFESIDLTCTRAGMPTRTAQTTHDPTPMDGMAGERRK